MNNNLHSRPAYKGRNFYLMLTAFVGILLVMLLGGLYICLTSYQTAREQSTQALDIAMRAYDLYLQGVKTSPTETDTIQLLNGDGAIDAILNSGGVNPEGEIETRVMERLDRLHTITTDTDRLFYLYFEEYDAWLASPHADNEDVAFAKNVLEQFDKGYMSAPDVLDVYDTRIVRDDFGSLISTSYKRILPGVLFIQIGTMPTLPSPESLSELFSTAEMFFIDRYDGVYPFQPDSTLMGKFTYADVAPTGDNQIIPIDIGSTPYRCYVHATNPGSMSFVFMSPDVAAIEQERLTGLTLIIGAILTILGVIVCYVIANRLYRPVRMLIGQLSDTDQGIDKNEFKFIHSAMSEMESRLCQQKTLVDRYRLLCVLRGQETENGWALALGMDDIQFYGVAALRVDARVNGEPGWNDLARLETQLSDYLTDCGARTMTTIDSGLLFVVFGAESKEDQSIVSLLGTFKELEESRDGLLISAFISTVRSCSAPPALAYNEVLEIVDYEAVTEEFNIIVSYKAVKANLESAANSAALNKDIRLSAAIIALNEELTLRLYDEIVREITASSCLSYIRFRLGALRAHIMLACSEAETACTEKVPDVSIAERFNASDASSTSRIREILTGILSELKTAPPHTAGGDNQFDEMLQFVNEHYRDPSFSASTVAKHFSTSQSNVTRLFNRFNNSGFLEYVHSLRIAKARELMGSTNAPISEIALMVGYTNSLTMTRAFKRYTGTTPGSFRSN